MPIDETNLDTADLSKIKEALRFLITQEKIRQQEVEALKAQIAGVDKYAKGYVDDQNFNAFKEKYGEELEPYNATFRVTETPDFDMVRQSYDTMKEAKAEKPELVEEDFIAQVKELADAKVAEIKDVLGIPAEQNVTIEETDEGTVVKTDEDGDGTPETPVEETAAEAPAEEKPAEEEAPAEEETEETPSEDEISAEDKKDIDDAVDAYTPRH